MSDRVDSLAMEYRAFVASFAKKLSAEEIYEVAFIWVKPKRDISIYEPSNEKRACGLKLFAQLECLGIFSWKETSGLENIAKGLNRSDLLDEVKRFKKNKGKACGRRYTKKKASSFSEERQQLEETFENLVVQSAVLEQQISQLQSLLQRPDCIIDDGLEVVQQSGALSQRLASSLNDVQKKLARRSRADSGTSLGSDSSGDSRCSSGELSALPPLPEYSSAAQDTAPAPSPYHTPPAHQRSPPPNRDKPIPKPRSQRFPQCAHPAQESHGNASEFVRPSGQAELAYPKTSHPPTVPPRMVVGHASSLPVSPSLWTGTRGTARVEGVGTEEDDWTGDSGMGTGSDSAQCGGIEEWRRAMKHPPPVKPRTDPPLRRDNTDKGDSTTDAHLYTPLREGTTDKGHSYTALDRRLMLF
jgi:hypothetical protein